MSVTQPTSATQLPLVLVSPSYRHYNVNCNRAYEFPGIFTNLHAWYHTEGLVIDSGRLWPNMLEEPTMVVAGDIDLASL